MIFSLLNKIAHSYKQVLALIQVIKFVLNNFKKFYDLFPQVLTYKKCKDFLRLNFMVNEELRICPQIVNII